MKTKNICEVGFTLVEIMIVVAIIGILAAITIPNATKARTVSQKNACIANLKKIEGAKATWALETKQSSTASPTDADLFGTDKYIREKPQCPQGESENDSRMDGIVDVVSAIDQGGALHGLDAGHNGSVANPRRHRPGGARAGMARHPGWIGSLRLTF